jgi:alpha-mannosidase
MTLSNADGYFMRLGRSTISYLDTRTPQISVLAGGQVDGPGLGIPAQGGDDYFLQRFALQTHDAFDPAAAMRFALEHQNPLVTGEVKGGTKYPGDLYSFLEVDDPDVLIWALKPAEETSENGVIARFWNLAISPADLALRPSGYSLVEAKRTTHIETPLENANLENGLLKVSVGPRQWLTYYLRLRGTPSLIKPGPRERIRTKLEGTRLDSSAAIPRKL